MDQSVLKKVRDLLRLQRRAATEGEAKAAAFGLGKLLTKHQLDLASIEDDVSQTSAMVDAEPLETFGRMCRWRTELASAVCGHLGVAFWLRTNTSRGPGFFERKVSIIMCGREGDTQAARALYSWLLVESQRICAAKGYVQKRRNDWLLGFAVGVHEQLREAKKQAAEEHEPNPRGQSAAIVLASLLDESTALRDKIIGDAKDHRMRTPMVYLDTYNDGRQSGRRVNVGQRLESQSRQLQHGSGS